MALLSAPDRLSSGFARMAAKLLLCSWLGIAQSRNATSRHMVLLVPSRERFWCDGSRGDLPNHCCGTAVSTGISVLPFRVTQTYSAWYIVHVLGSVQHRGPDMGNRLQGPLHHANTWLVHSLRQVAKHAHSTFIDAPCPGR